jgi:hypothetical protein
MGTESLNARLREISMCNKTIQRQIVSVDEESWSGRHVCLQVGRHSGVAMLQKHAQCKSEDPTGTSALVVVPQAVHAQCTPLLANMFCLGQHKIYQNGPNTWVYRDDPRKPQVSTLLINCLPEAIKVLRAGELSNHSLP